MIENSSDYYHSLIACQYSLVTFPKLTYSLINSYFQATTSTTRPAPSKYQDSFELLVSSKSYSLVLCVRYRLKLLILAIFSSVPYTLWTVKESQVGHVLLVRLHFLWTCWIPRTEQGPVLRFLSHLHRGFPCLWSLHFLLQL